VCELSEFQPSRTKSGIRLFDTYKLSNPSDLHQLTIFKVVFAVDWVLRLFSPMRRQVSYPCYHHFSGAHKSLGPTSPSSRRPHSSSPPHRRRRTLPLRPTSSADAIAPSSLMSAIVPPHLSASSPTCRSRAWTTEQLHARSWKPSQPLPCAAGRLLL
jgi:hypothetical protein